MNKTELLDLMRELTQLPAEEDTMLLGGQMDSFDFVQFLVSVEHEVHQRTGKDIVIQSKVAFSRQNSPFKTFGTLADFVLELMG